MKNFKLKAPFKDSAIEWIKEMTDLSEFEDKVKTKTIKFGHR